MPRGSQLMRTGFFQQAPESAQGANFMKRTVYAVLSHDHGIKMMPSFASIFPSNMDLTRASMASGP